MKGELELPPGFRFHPTDDELVNHYLCRKCASQPIAVPIIAEIDLYKFDPWQLPGLSFYICLICLVLGKKGRTQKIILGSRLELQNFGV